MTARDYHASWALKYASVGWMCNIVGITGGRTKGAVLLVLVGTWLMLLGLRHSRLAK